MTFFETIESYHLDILKEIGNIGAGSATTALSEILNRKMTMTVPHVEIVSFNRMMEMMGGADTTVASVFLKIEGDAPGSMYFVLPLAQATQFIHNITGLRTFSFSEAPYPDMALSALQEIGNIVAGSYLSALADFTKLSIYPSVPALTIDMVGASLSYGLVELSQMSDHAIIIDTAFIQEEDATDLKGHFIFLPDPDSFQKIFKALGV